MYYGVQQGVSVPSRLFLYDLKGLNAEEKQEGLWGTACSKGHIDKK